MLKIILVYFVHWKLKLLDFPLDFVLNYCHGPITQLEATCRPPCWLPKLLWIIIINNLIVMIYLLIQRPLKFIEWSKALYNPRKLKILPWTYMKDCPTFQLQNKKFFKVLVIHLVGIMIWNLLACYHKNLYVWHQS